MVLLNRHMALEDLHMAEEINIETEEILQEILLPTTCIKKKGKQSKNSQKKEKINNLKTLREDKITAYGTPNEAFCNTTKHRQE